MLLYVNLFCTMEKHYYVVSKFCSGILFCFKLHASSLVRQKWKEIFMLMSLLRNLQKGK